MSNPNPSKSRLSKAGGPLSAQLHFERKNKKQPRLPPNVVIERRPINHPPIANPYVGAHVPKIVYVSTSTPMMAAVKRVRKLLHQVEKRALSKVKLPDLKQNAKKGDKMFLEAIESAAEVVGKETVYVKASGRAVEKALRIGEWLKGKEGGVNVRVETGSTIVVDDLVEVQPDRNKEAEDNGQGEQTTNAEIKGTAYESGENPSAPNTTSATNIEEQKESHNYCQNLDERAPSENPTAPPTRKRKKKRKREMYDLEIMPEARTRWIKTIEVAISLKAPKA